MFINHLVLFTVLIGFLLVACNNAEDQIDDSLGARGEDEGIYIVSVTEAEEATFSCGEYGFGMGLEESDLPMVQCITEKSRGKEGRAALLNGMMTDAIHSSNAEAVAFLLATGVDATGEGPFGETFLLAAITNLTFLDHGTGPMEQREKAVSVAGILVEEGAQVSDPPGEEFVNAWFLAAQGSPDSVDAMVRAGIGVNIRPPLDENFDLNTALVGAVRRACWGGGSESGGKNLEIVGLLVGAGADVNTMSIGQILDDNLGNVVGLYENSTLLEIADGGQKECPEVVAMLREAGACQHLVGRRVEWGANLDFEGIARVLSAPSAFAPKGNVECAVVDSSPDPPRGGTEHSRLASLNEAIFRDDRDQLREMVAAGSDVNAADQSGEPPLQFAVFIRNNEMVRFLLELGADVNGLDSRGETALHDAIIFGDVDLVRLLIEFGADGNAADSSGMSLLEWARVQGNPEIVRLLEDAGAQ